MCLIQDGYRPGRVDVERRRADCAELSPLLQSDLRRTVSPRGQCKPHVSATGVAERVAAECDVDRVLEWTGRMRRVGASGRDGDPLTEIGCLELRVVLEATGLRGERAPERERRAAVPPLSDSRAFSASRSNEPRPAAADEDCAADLAASFGSLVVSGGAVHVVCELGTLVRHREKWRKVRRIEYGALLWAGPLRRGGAESYRRDTGGTADDDSENQYGQSPTQRLLSSHVALLCSLLRQQ